MTDEQIAAVAAAMERAVLSAVVASVDLAALMSHAMRPALAPLIRAEGRWRRCQPRRMRRRLGYVRGWR